MEKYKIAFVIPTLDKGGAERVLVHFVNNLDYSKYQPIIFCLKKKGDLLAAVNKEVVVVDLDSPRVYFSIFKIRREVKKYKPIVLIGWMGHVNAVLAFYRSLLPSGLTLMCRESSIPSKFINYYRAPGIFRFMYRFLNRHEGIICQSDAMRQDLEEHFKVDHERICVINNPVVLPPGNSLLSVEAVSFIGANTGKLLLFVGRFSQEKQAELAIEVMPLLPAEYKLVLVGYGPMDQEIRGKISAAGLTGRILIIGDCTDPTPYYQQAGCLVLTSSFEGFPNVLLEANLQGCPVVVYKTKGGAREIVTPDNGVYIEPDAPGGLEQFAEAVRSVCEYPGRYNRHEIASKTKEQYGIQKTICSYLDYIEKIVKKRKTG